MLDGSYWWQMSAKNDFIYVCRMYIALRFISALLKFAFIIYPKFYEL
jgi:hypothetical protein